MKHIFRILRFTSNLWRYYVAIGALSILTSIFTLLLPLISGRAIDELRLGSDARVGYMFGLAVAIFVLDLLTNVVGNFIGFLGDQMGARLDKSLSVRYYEHLMTLPQRYFDTELTGKIVARLNRSIAQISQFMLMWSNSFLQFIFTTVFSLLAVAYYSWEVALMLSALYPIYIWLTLRSSSTWQGYQAQRNHHVDIANGRFIESIGQVKVVKSFIQEARELKVFRHHYSKVVDIVRPQSIYWHLRDTYRKAILNVIFFGVYSFIFVRAAQGAFTPGEAVALMLLAYQIRIPIFTISFLVENTQKAVADSKDYFEIMDLKPAIADRPDAARLVVKKGQIEFDQVTFSYNKEPVIADISFKIAKGSKVALVGESGEGKTTLTNLLMRLYEPSNGLILIDGQDIAGVTQNSLREQIGVVFQDPALFSGTIYENISYSRPDASHEDVVAAARAANADEFTEKQEKGYQTEIGERGLKLSGGQKQRIAIARALLKDAPILILDEATSSLDSKSEAMVQEALARLMRGRTTIIIAHRLSTIQNVDTIITLRGGKVSEIGSPDELASSGGIYDQLLKLQRGDATESKKKKLKEFEIAS